MFKLRFRQIHLDFHTSEEIVGIGEQFDPDDFAQTLKNAYVDSITCFSRCHHGWIYHDTKFQEFQHPHLKTNLLKEQIDACHAQDIRVPIYITVGWDVLMGRTHPEWRELSADGKLGGAAPLQPGWPVLCFNTPYIDFVVEQTEEVLGMFEVDGLFFDIIKQGPCCCQYCMQGMVDEGLDPGNGAHRDLYAERVLRRFKERMTNAVRALNKECSIFYNAGHVGPDIRDTLDTYTHLELESLPSGGWGYTHFPTTVRFARNLGLDMMGMTGKFQKSWADFGAFKNEAALEYECFTALANTAKCSIGDQLHPSGAITHATYDLIGGVYKSVAEKEPWCVDAEAVTEVAILTPEAIGSADSRVDTAMAGAYHMLVESHHQFDIVDTRCDLAKYSVLILPDKITLDASLKAALQQHLQKGGSLLLSYESGMARDERKFALEELGVEFLNEAAYSPDYVVAGPEIAEGILESEHVMYDRGFEVSAATDAQVLAEVHHPYFNRNYKHFCSHRHTPVEKLSAFPAAIQRGQIIYFAHPIFSMYKRHGARVYKRMVLNSLARLLPEKLIQTDAPTTAHITLTRQPSGRTIAHLLHYIPERRYEGIDTIEEVIPLYNVQLAVRLQQAPTNAYLAPSQEPLQVDYAGGYASVTVPKVDGHAMVVFE